CNKFDTLRKLFPDELDGSGEYDFKVGMFKSYCPKEQCNNDIDKINAGCLWLFYDFFGKPGTSVDNNTYKDDLVCIMIWLSYILNLKPPDKIVTLKDFYSSHIENNTEYTNRNVNDRTYGTYKNIIDAIKEYMDIDINNMSKFYELLKLLCKMNTAYKNDNISDFSDNTNKFVNKYKNLFNGINNDSNSYDKVLLVLSKYYNNFENGRSNKTQMKRPSLPTEKTPPKVKLEGSIATKTTESSSEIHKSDIEATPSYDTTLSDSSLVNKLVLVLSPLVAIPIFLGISYKYSLFGFRKRSQKQHLRKKLKK
ncbi:putative bir1 protein, partial [Plasmodium yoelii yoelii]